MDQMKQKGRLSLLAGASLIAATLATGAPVLFAPGTALAANECGDPNTNLTSADTFTCLDTTTYTAITYPATNGNLTLRLQNDVVVTTGGIVITPTGANTVTINRIENPNGGGDPQITSTSGPGISVTRSAGFNGGITVDLSDNDQGDTAMAIRGTTAGISLSNAGTGNTTLTTTNGTITATNGVGVILGTVGTGNLTFNNGSDVTGTTGAVTFAQGVNATLTNNGLLDGLVTFNNTGTSTFTLNRNTFWRAGGTAAMGSGSSTLNNHGTIVVDGTLAFTSLETFATSGAIMFGRGANDAVTDGATNDRLVLGANLTLLQGPTLAIRSTTQIGMDFAVGGADQVLCSAAVSADCLDMRGFSVLDVGFAEFVLNPVAGGSTALGDKIVLLDASGGTLGAARFSLSPNSVGYIEGANGAVGIDAGTLAYIYMEDEAADQIYLAVAPGSRTGLLAQLPTAVASIWDLTASAMVDRQLELHQGQGGGAWVRGASGYLDESGLFDAGPFAHEIGYDQETSGVVAGGDFGGAGWAVGLALASVDSEINPDVLEDIYEMSGHAIGAYGSWSGGPVYIDGLVNYLTLDTSSNVAAADGEATALGARGEAGYRFALNDGAVSFEPLAALNWTSVDAGEIALTDGFTVGADSVSSLMAGLGARIAAGGEFGGLDARAAFTARAWQPISHDESVTTLEGAASQTFIQDDNADVLGDIAFTAKLSGLGGRLALSASAGMKFKEEQEAGEFLVGLRYRF